MLFLKNKDSFGKKEDSMIIKLEERRRNYRLHISVPLYYQIVGTQEFGHTVSDNISFEGIGFIADRFIATKVTVFLRINIANRILSPIGKVIWSLSLAHSDKYRIGVVFLNLDFKEKRYLQDFLSAQIQIKN